MLTMIRNWLDIQPGSDLDKVMFYEDGWKSVLTRTSHALGSILEAWWWQNKWSNLQAFTVKARKKRFNRSDRHLLIWDEGTFKEQIQYMFTPQGVIDRYGLMRMETRSAIALAPIRKARTFPVVIPPQR